MKVFLCSPLVPPRASASRASDRGIALIVTLIMLSVITFLTVTFLVLSQRERASVSTTTEQLIAKQHADTALERAKIELLGPMLATTNSQLYDLLVSTNFINRAGFDPNLAQVMNPFTNVNYDYLISGGGLNANHRLWVLTNLYYNPRPPVFVTNRITGGLEFRYYLDLNRNRRFDTNGWVREIGIDGFPTGQSNFVWQVGDPEWIGVLERPDQPHSSSNKFIGRYAFVALPSGKTLDLNYIHNQAKLTASSPPGNPNQDGFFRNQGVGSYEINLAAFLTDLNPRLWNPVGNAFLYDLDTSLSSRGLGFQHAWDLLRYRYAGSSANLNSAGNLFPNGAQLFQRDRIDQYANGPLMVTNPIVENPANADPVVSSPWAGSDNPNHFFTPQELFESAKVNPNNLPNSIDVTLAGAGMATNLSTFDRYTFYRMLAQLGTSSEPDRRMNLNYVNVDHQMRVVPGMETNLIHWTPIQFFTNAADRLLRAQFRHDYFGIPNICVTNIPVIVSNQFVYTPAINRLLQLAANIFEATTNSLGPAPLRIPYPRIYRPLFALVPGTNGLGDELYIRGFEEVTNAVVAAGNLALIPPTNAFQVLPSLLPHTPTRINIYEVPWIVGARKGLPNLNEITAASRFNITRRMMVTRASVDTSQENYQYFEQYRMDLWQELGVEAWNSYSSDFPAGGNIYVDGDFSYALTNRINNQPAAFSPNPPLFRYSFVLPITNAWRRAFSEPAIQNEAAHPASFITALRTNFMIVTNMLYDPNNRRFHTNGNEFYAVSLTPQQWGLSLTNRIRVIITDPTGRIIDYAHFSGPSAHRNLSAEVWTDGADQSNLQLGNGANDATAGEYIQLMWDTNLAQNASPPLPRGLVNQRALSQLERVSDTVWQNYGANVPRSRDSEVERFRKFMRKQGTDLRVQVPFTPTKAIAQRITWQANDPLVHYMPEDMVDLATTLAYDRINPPTTSSNLLPNIGLLNRRYDPWGGRPKTHDEQTGANDATAFNIHVKDPGMWDSRFWNFPTNKLGNLGWLGRVHRGTPWQTIYMKAGNAFRTEPNGTSLWGTYSGHWNIHVASNTAPIWDRIVFDLFTTAPNENSGRGRLSVNQTNLAAWSAVLSGVVTLTNTPAGVQPEVIQPAALSNQVAQMVAGIIRTKTQLLTNGNQVQWFPNGEFARLGDILAVPELSETSPFLNLNLLNRWNNGLTDTVIERVPQQIMSLLSFNAPRFEIYGYGQSLRPAPNSVVRSFGAFGGICTNYQVTAESAIRAVVRVDGSFDPRDAGNPDPSRRYPPRLVMEEYNPLPPD